MPPGCVKPVEIRVWALVPSRLALRMRSLVEDSVQYIFPAVGSRASPLGRGVEPRTGCTLEPSRLARRMLSAALSLQYIFAAVASIVSAEKLPVIAEGSGVSTDEPSKFARWIDGDAVQYSLSAFTSTAIEVTNPVATS